MSTFDQLTAIGPPVPELPVADVERAQQHYRDALGFEIGWLEPDKSIGAVLRGQTTLFLRKPGDLSLTRKAEPASEQTRANSETQSHSDQL